MHPGQQPFHAEQQAEAEQDRETQPPSHAPPAQLEQPEQTSAATAALEREEKGVRDSTERSAAAQRADLEERAQQSLELCALDAQTQWLKDVASQAAARAQAEADDVGPQQHVPQPPPDSPEVPQAEASGAGSEAAAAEQGLWQIVRAEAHVREARAAEQQEAWGWVQTKAWAARRAAQRSDRLRAEEEELRGRVGQDEARARDGLRLLLVARPGPSAPTPGRSRAAQAEQILQRCRALERSLQEIALAGPDGADAALPTPVSERDGAAPEGDGAVAAVAPSGLSPVDHIESRADAGQAVSQRDSLASARAFLGQRAALDAGAGPGPRGGSSYQRRRIESARARSAEGARDAARTLAQEEERERAAVSQQQASAHAALELEEAEGYNRGMLLGAEGVVWKMMMDGHTYFVLMKEHGLVQSTRRQAVAYAEDDLRRALHREEAAGWLALVARAEEERRADTLRTECKEFLIIAFVSTQFLEFAGRRQVLQSHAQSWDSMAALMQQHLKIARIVQSMQRSASEQRAACDSEAQVCHPPLCAYVRACVRARVCVRVCVRVPAKPRIDHMGFIGCWLIVSLTNCVCVCVCVCVCACAWSRARARVRAQARAWGARACACACACACVCVWTSPSCEK